MCSISASACARQAKDSNSEPETPCVSLFCGILRETFLLHLRASRRLAHASNAQDAPSDGQVFHRRCYQGALDPSEHCPDSWGGRWNSRVRRLSVPALNLNAKPARLALHAGSPLKSGLAQTCHENQASTSASRANSWMNSRRGSTRSPISLENISSAVSAWSTFTCSSRRAFGSSVVSQSCSGFISPRPL